MYDDNCWSLLPEPVLLYIFCLLDIPSQAAAALVCTWWSSIIKNSYLWKLNLARDFHITYTAPAHQHVYKHKYKQLYYHTPVFETEVLTDNTDEVWQVIFSHSGTMFGTKSKINKFMVWANEFPVRLITTIDTRLLCWSHIYTCEFNPDDTILLLSGQRGQRYELALFDVQKNFKLISRFNIKNSYACATWYNSTHLLTCYKMYPLMAFDLMQVPGDPQKKTLVCKLPGGEFYNPNFFKVATIPQGPSGNAADVRKCVIFVSGNGSVLNFKILKVGDISNIEQIIGSADAVISQHRQFSEVKEDEDISYVAQDSSSADEDSFSDEEDGGNSVDFVSHPDASFDVNGEIASVTLMPDHKLLDVLYRPYKEDGATLSNDFEIKTFNVVTFKQTNKTFKAKDAFQLSFTPVLVMSGSSDYGVCMYDNEQSNQSPDGDSHYAYMWDRETHRRLYRYPHSKGVDGLVFNPTDEGMLVTGSDDHTVKIWRSREQLKSHNHPYTLTKAQIITTTPK